MEEIYTSASVAETQQIAESLSARLSGLIAFYGSMGVGKTAFVSGFVRGRGLTCRVSSPTYTVMNCYAADLFHLDLYRVESEDDLESVGFYDIPENATVLCEWSEHLPKHVRPDVSVFLERSDDGDGRTIKVVYECRS